MKIANIIIFIGALTAVLLGVASFAAFLWAVAVGLGLFGG